MQVERVIPRTGKLPLLLALLAMMSCCCTVVWMQLIHADAGRGLAGRELLQRIALRSKARAARLLSSSESASVDPGTYTVGGVPDTEYLVHLDIGTPPQPVQLTLDTGSDLTWTQCLPCPACFDQSLPYFNPFSSSTFARLPCGSSECRNLRFSSCGTQQPQPQNFWGNQTCVYTKYYGDKSVTTGSLGMETFTFSAGAGAGKPASVPDLAFGCGLFNRGVFKSIETGIAGFGRGALSLPSQLRVDNFSYCFTAITGSKPSPVLLGLPADLYSNAGGAVQTTPLIRNHASPSFYHLSLKGITVGSKRLPVQESAFALRNDGTGGTIIDFGTSITSLPTAVYRLLRDAFASQVKLPPAASNQTDPYLCFTAPAGAKPDVPKLVLHLEGATMDLPRENYVFEVDEAAAGRSIVCLAILELEDRSMTIVGNYQQQNMHVLYDLANNKLSFVPAQCDKI